jgi:transcriptional regulator with XRE-family HTH domain
MQKNNGRQFGSRLKELREHAGLTQQQLAENAGIHTLTVAKLEQGIREPTWATVQALADALGLSCEAFSTPAAAREPMGRGRPAKPHSGEPADAMTSKPKRAPKAGPAKQRGQENGSKRRQ